MRSTLILALVASFVALAAVACSHDELAAKTASNVVVVGVAQPTNASVPVTPRTDQFVNVGPKFRKACGIDDVNEAPKFDFDQSKLSSNDRHVLDQVATCLTTGPLKGHTVSLVGRADPRGESEYNMNLGAERAMSAKGYLERLGVQQSRVQDTSRGALDATGHDAESWRLDRRVDIELAD
jgi:peptidoglycan-associated lipoprotein